MDAATVQAAVMVGLPLIGVLIWLVRLEGRVNTHAEMYSALRDMHSELRKDLTYIRDRIDRALNGIGR